MSAKYLAILTNLGAAKMANATMLGAKLNVTHMAVGDGGGTLPTPDPAQTALRGERRRASLNMLSVDPNNASQIIAEQVIPETEGGWWIREIGLYDSDGVMIAVANCPETYKPQLQEGSGRTQTIRMVLTVSSTEAVTLKIDPAVVLATRQYVDDKVIEGRSYIDRHLDEHARSRNHPDATTAAKGFVQLSSDDNSAAENKAATPAAVKKVRDLAETKAPLDSPSFTGNPTTPTPALSARGLEMANAEFVAAKVAELVGSAPGVLDTLQEIAAALNNNPDFANEMIRQLAGKQPLSSTLTDISGKNVAQLIEYLQLGNCATKNIGQSSGTVCAGDDGRFGLMLGVGQTWQTFGSSERTPGVTYTNTTGRPIFVSICNGTKNECFMYVGDNIVAQTSINGTGVTGSQNYMGGIVVPNLYTYRFTGVLTSWLELR